MAWSVAGSAVMRIGQVLIGIAAARILVPEDFGLFAVTLVVYTVAVNIAEFGVSSALIRTNRSLDEIAPTAVTLSMTSAALLALLVFLAAPFTARELGASDAVGPIRVMALVVLLSGPAAVPSALLTRHFQQKRRFVADVGGFVVGNAALILLALTGWGAFALAWSRVMGQATTLAFILRLAPARHRPGFDRRVAVWLIGFGLPLVGANLIAPTAAAVDVAAVGRALGAVALGSYSLAQNVAGWPVILFLPVLMNVGLPLISRYNRAPEQLAAVLRCLVAATALVFFPVAALIAALSPALVASLYGDKWAAAAPILGVLGLVGGVRVMTALFSDVLVALNATRSLLIVQIVCLVALVPAVLAGVAWRGALGAAVATGLVALLVGLPLTVVLATRAGAPAARHLAKGAVLPLVAAGVAGVCARLVLQLWTGWTALALGTAAGGAVYVLCVWPYARRLFPELASMLGRDPLEEEARRLQTKEVSEDR